MRRILFEVFNIVLAVVEWTFIYLFLMFITGDSIIITSIIIGLFICLVVYALFLNHRHLYFVQDEKNHDYIDALEKHLNSTFKNKYDVDIVIRKLPFPSPAGNINKSIVINCNYLDFFFDETGDFNHSKLEGIIAHEIGHRLSGISKAKAPILRLSTFIVNGLLLLLNFLSKKKKNRKIYYLVFSIYILFLGINLNFLFKRNDEYYANKKAMEAGFGFELYKYYIQMKGSKPMHDIDHPTPYNQAKRLEAYLEQIYGINIFRNGYSLAYEPTSENLEFLNIKANENDSLALYEYGYNQMYGRFKVQKNKLEGLEKIKTSANLKNPLAIGFLLANYREFIDEAFLNTLDIPSKQLEYYRLYISENTLKRNEKLFLEAVLGNKLAIIYYLEILLKEEHIFKAARFYNEITNVYSLLNIRKEPWVKLLKFAYKFNEKNIFVDQELTRLIINKNNNEKSYFWNFMIKLLENELSKEKTLTIYKDLIEKTILNHEELLKINMYEDFYLRTGFSFKIKENEDKNL